MTHEWPIRHTPGPSQAGDRLAQLREVLALVEQIAGSDAAAGNGDVALHACANLSSAYDDAPPVVQKRFDALAAETAAWAAAGVEALAAASDAGVPKAAATALAGELSNALRHLGRTLGA